MEVSVARPFGDGGRFGLETRVAAGVRWRLAGSERRDFALRVMGFRGEWSGRRGQRDLGGYGIAVGIFQARLAR
jgi:hypothetical protein